MSFAARFHVGALIAYDDDDELRRASCGDNHHDPEPCTRCWLTICDYKREETR